MNFPDTEKALQEVIRTITANVVLWLPADTFERVPIVHVQVQPNIGGEEDFLRTERVQIDVYATGRDAAKTLAQNIRSTVLGHHGTSYGLLDDVYVDTEPYEQPYPHDTVSLYSAIYRVDTRPL